MEIQSVSTIKQADYRAYSLQISPQKIHIGSAHNRASEPLRPNLCFFFLLSSGLGEERELEAGKMRHVSNKKRYRKLEHGGSDSVLFFLTMAYDAKKHLVVRTIFSLQDSDV